MRRWKAHGATTLSVLLVGCQNASLIDEYVHDPVKVKPYEFPVPFAHETTEHNYRQIHQDQIWFWSILPNETHQQGENIIVQVVSHRPLEQPPTQFGFRIPSEKGIKTVNALGPYQFWQSQHALKTVQNSKNSTDPVSSVQKPLVRYETCIISSQYQKRGSNWISVFTHVCRASEAPPESWADVSVPKTPSLPVTPKAVWSSNLSSVDNAPSPVQPPQRLNWGF